MNEVELRSRVLLELERSNYAGEPAVDVATLSRRLGEPAVRVATIAANLVQHGHVDGDGNMMGFVGLSDGGRAYLAATRELS